MMKNFSINTKVPAFLLGAVCLSVSSCSSSEVSETEAVPASNEPADVYVNDVERVSISDNYSLNYGYAPYEVDPVTGRQIRPEDKDLRIPSSVVVCRSKKCAPALSNMSTEFLYNAYYNLLENNVGTNVMLCSADSTSHVCYEPFISFDVSAGITPATVVIDSINIADLGMIRGNQAMTPVMDYSIYVNGIKTKCTPFAALTKVKSPNYIVVDGMDSECRFTATGKSMMSMVFTIDYIDFDYGIVGASYSVGVSGTTSGGRKGYALLRFKNPVTGDIIKSTCDKDKNACEKKFDAAKRDSRFFTRCDGNQNVSSVYPYAPCSSAANVGKDEDKAEETVDTSVKADAAKAESVKEDVKLSETAQQNAAPQRGYEAYDYAATSDSQGGYAPNAYAMEEQPQTAEGKKVGILQGWFGDNEKEASRMRNALPLEYDVGAYADGRRFYREGRAIIYDDFANGENPANLVVISPFPKTVKK